MGHLRVIAKNCTRLETLIFYNLWSYGHRTSGLALFTLGEISHELLPLADNLKHFELCRLKTDILPIAQEEPNVSLRQLTVLKTIVLDGCFLLCQDDSEVETQTDGQPLTFNSSLANLLPSSVEKVIINGRDISLYDELIGLAREAKRGLFPHLKTFKQTSVDPIYSEATIRAIEVALNEAWISFELHQGEAS
ncbi:hypothetical protein BGZ63DRAFT_426424 [Mariannaea sp. PMI_226]|nr:hypothetical protein BGZ63DRAFT_426424 [Mariannaea sp. PMI_226]